MEEQNPQIPQAQVDAQVQGQQSAPIQTDSGSQSDWQSHLVEATGGRIKTADELKEIFGKYDEYQTKATQLSERWEKLNPIDRKRIEMREAGAAEDEIERWHGLQRIDVSKLSDVELIQNRYKMEQPQLSDKDIEEFIEEKFGDPSELTGSKKIEFLQMVKDAKSFLNSQIVAAEPQALKTKQETELRQQQYLGDLNQAFQSLKNENFLSEITLKTEGVADVEGGVLEMKVPISNEVREKVYLYAKEHAAMNGINPKDKEALNEVFEQYLWALDGKRISQLREANALAVGKRLGNKANAGSAITPEVTAEAAKPNKSPLDAFVEMRRG